MPGRRALLLEPDYYGPESHARLRAAGLEPFGASCETSDELSKLLIRSRDSGDPPFLAVFARLGLTLDAKVLGAAGRDLEYLVTPTTGLGHIDTADAGRRGIRVLSLKGETGFLRTITSTAELAFGMLLALVRRLPSAHADVLSLKWRREPFRGRELRGMTLGIVGLGRLGTMVAGYGRAFGMKVMACDTRSEAFAEAANSHVERRDIETLLSESDVVSLHLPLEESTEGYLDSGRISRMKPGAWLINTARGEIADESALLAALESGRLAGCALDVLCGDSRWDDGVPEDNPLVAYARRRDNLILTPHIGGYSLDAITRTRSFMVDRLCRCLAPETQPDSTENPA